MRDYILWIFISFLLSHYKFSDGSCTFPSEIDGVWVSAHKGSLTFNNTHLTGYPIYMSHAVQSLDFECYEQSDRKYLLRATETALVFGQNIRGYLCIQLWRVSATKYYYYIGTALSLTNNDYIYGRVDSVAVDTTTACNAAEPYSTMAFVMLVKNAISATNNDYIRGQNDRLSITMEEVCNVPEPYATGAFIMLVKDAISRTNGDNIFGSVDTIPVDMTLGCNEPEPYATSSFIVLIKDGEVSLGSAEASCPTAMLANFAALTITDSSGATTCSGSSVNVCNDNTEMNYTIDASCASALKFSSGGYWVCLHSIEDGTTTYMTAWNNDTTVDGTSTYRFVCYALTTSSTSDTTYATVHPEYCKDSTQTSTSVPSPGTVHVYSSPTLTCYDVVESGSSAVYYATIALGAMFLISLVILIICLYKKGCCRAIKRKCQKRPTSATSSVESTVEQGEQVNRPIFKTSAKKLKPIAGFKAKRPLRVGPIVEPSLEPLPKVEPLYAILDPIKKRLLKALLRSNAVSKKLSDDETAEGSTNPKIEVSIDINVHDFEDGYLPAPRKPTIAGKLRFTRSIELPNEVSVNNTTPATPRKSKKGNKSKKSYQQSPLMLMDNTDTDAEILKCEEALNMHLAEQFISNVVPRPDTLESKMPEEQVNTTLDKSPSYRNRSEKSSTQQESSVKLEEGPSDYTLLNEDGMSSSSSCYEKVQYECKNSEDAIFEEFAGPFPEFHRKERETSTQNKEDVDPSQVSQVDIQHSADYMAIKESGSSHTDPNQNHTQRPQGNFSEKMDETRNTDECKEKSTDDRASSLAAKEALEQKAQEKSGSKTDDSKQLDNSGLMTALAIIHDENQENEDLDACLILPNKTKCECPEDKQPCLKNEVKCTHIIKSDTRDEEHNTNNKEVTKNQPPELNVQSKQENTDYYKSDKEDIQIPTLKGSKFGISRKQSTKVVPSTSFKETKNAMPGKKANINQESVIKQLWSKNSTYKSNIPAKKVIYSRQTYNDTNNLKENGSPQRGDSSQKQMCVSNTKKSNDEADKTQ